MAIVLHTGWMKPIERATPVVGTVDEPASYREFVFRCALAICGDPDSAEDVAQEVILTLLRTSRRLARTENPQAWVRRITVRCATRYLKRQKRSSRMPQQLGSRSFSTDDLAVYCVLKEMTPEQRALLGMALNQGLSYREIAEALDIPEGTVASRLNTAKKEFQRRWGHER